MSRDPIQLDLLPSTAQVVDGRLTVGGCDVIDLVEQFGSPLFVYDEQHLIDRCNEAVSAFGIGVAYASKAFLCRAMVKIAADAGMNIDVATGGELHVALSAGVSPQSIVFHGNNKSTSEIQSAIHEGVGTIVVDSFDEMRRIEVAMDEGAGEPPDVLIRVNPGIEAHTHEYLQTGIPDSKFGFPISDGTALAAIRTARESSAMRYRGVHAHIGSQVFDVSSYQKAIAALAPFVNESDAEEFSVGGGLGVAYVAGEDDSTITDWAAIVKSAVREAGIVARITAEPGRSIVAQAALTAYTVGTIKTVPDVRTYLAVDGGMSDNPRPVLYGSGYEAFLPRSVESSRDAEFRIVGKHCESGDVIVKHAYLPGEVAIGDIICTPVTGAYGHAMGSNYNKVLRPAVVFVKDGNARLVVRRETNEDLLATDVG